MGCDTNCNMIGYENGGVQFQCNVTWASASASSGLNYEGYSRTYLPYLLAVNAWGHQKTFKFATVAGSIVAGPQYRTFGVLKEPQTLDLSFRTLNNGTLKPPESRIIAPGDMTFCLSGFDELGNQVMEVGTA